MTTIYEIHNISQNTYPLDVVYDEEDEAVKVAERLTHETGYTHIAESVHL